MSNKKPKLDHPQTTSNTQLDSEIPSPPQADNEVIDTSTTFSALGLDKTLCETCEKLKYGNPTKIQAQAIPVALQGKDIIGIAETGSGKTAAFVLPILHLLLHPEQLDKDSEKRYTRASPLSALVLSPTRELAEQIKQHFDALGSDIGLKTVLLVGGFPTFKQAQEIHTQKPHIVVGTPGRVVDHLKNTTGFALHKTRFLVLDEADKLLGVEFETELNFITSVINKKNRITYLYSATMTKNVEKLIKAHLNDPVKVQVTSSKYTTVKTLKQEYLLVPEKYKEIYLVYLLNENPGKRILIFVNQNVTCILLSIMLRSIGFPAVPLAGKMNDADRTHCLRKFKSGDRPILIATDVAARGLDIPLVEIVLNYDIPTHSPEYIHRVGRAARMGRDGRSITITTQYDVEYFQKIEKLMQKKMTLCPTNKEDVMVLQNTVNKALTMARKRIKDREEFKELTEKDDEEDVLDSAIKVLSSQKKLASQKKKKKKDKLLVKPNKAVEGNPKKKKKKRGKKRKRE